MIGAGVLSLKNSFEVSKAGGGGGAPGTAVSFSTAQALSNRAAQMGRTPVGPLRGYDLNDGREIMGFELDDGSLMGLSGEIEAEAVLNDVFDPT